MKILSITVPVRLEAKVREELFREIGVCIFREREILAPLPHPGRLVTHIMFLLWILDPEAETLLVLKYPYMFEDLSA